MQKSYKNPFTQERELAEKETRLAFLNSQLNIDGRPERVMEADESDPPQMAYAKSAKPSILENLRSDTTGK